MLSIAEIGFFDHGFAAGAVGGAGDLFVFGPKQDQAKAAEQRLTRGSRVIAHICVWVAANEGAFVARPNIAPGQLAGQIDAEMLFEHSFVGGDS